MNAKLLLTAALVAIASVAAIAGFAPAATAVDPVEPPVVFKETFDNDEDFYDWTQTSCYAPSGIHCYLSITGDDSAHVFYFVPENNTDSMAGSAAYGTTFPVFDEGTYDVTVTIGAQACTECVVSGVLYIDGEEAARTDGPRKSADEVSSWTTETHEFSIELSPGTHEVVIAMEPSLHYHGHFRASFSDIEIVRSAEDLFTEDFEENAAPGWDLDVCETNAQQSCNLTVANGRAYAMIIDGQPGNATQTTSASYTKQFTLAEAGEYDVSVLIWPNHCVGCTITGSLSIDGVHQVEADGQRIDATTIASGGPILSYSAPAPLTSTVNLEAGEHTVTITVQADRSYTSVFWSVFDDISIEPAVADPAPNPPELSYDDLT